MAFKEIWGSEWSQLLQLSYSSGCCNSILLSSISSDINPSTQNNFLCLTFVVWAKFLITMITKTLSLLSLASARVGLLMTGMEGLSVKECVTSVECPSSIITVLRRRATSFLSTGKVERIRQVSGIQFLQHYPDVISQSTNVNAHQNTFREPLNPIGKPLKLLLIFEDSGNLTMFRRTTSQVFTFRWSKLYLRCVNSPKMRQVANQYTIDTILKHLHPYSKKQSLAIVLVGLGDNQRTD